MTRILAPLLAGVALAGTVLTGAVPSPAHAAPPRAAASDTTAAVELSADGTTWSRNGPGAVFPDGIVLVPGDSASSTLWVRNGAGEAGVLVVAVTGIRADSPIAASAFSISASDGAGSGLAPTPLDALADCAHLVPSRVLAPGETVSITTTVALDPALTGKEAQNESMGFDMWVGLADAAVADPATSSGCPVPQVIVPVLPTEPPVAQATPAPGQGALPFTGGQVVWAVVAAGLAIGGVGWLSTMWARRRRRRA